MLREDFFIASQRLLLRPIIETDADALIAAGKAPENNYQGPKELRDDLLAKIKKIHESGGAWFIGFGKRHPHPPVLDIVLEETVDLQSFNVSVETLPSCRGQGYMGEAIDRLLPAVSSRIPGLKFTGTVECTNTSVLRMIEKTQFQEMPHPRYPKKERLYFEYGIS